MQSLFSGSLEFLSWLINYTKDVTILICLIFVIKFIAAKRLPAWWSYCLWLILLVRMLIPWEFQNWLNLSDLISFSTDKDLFALTFFGKEVVVTAKASSGWHGWTLPLDKTLLFLWIIGAVALGIYILSKNISFWITIKRTPLSNDTKTLILLEECKRQLNIHKAIDVIITDKVKSPALFGYFRPRLLLPEGILEYFNREALTYVFMHEMGHLRRHDIAVSCLMTLFLIVHWFNPLVWLAFYQMRIDQESACDASVLSRLRHPQSVEYANTIVGFLERYCKNRQLPSMAGILENKTQMKRRLTMIVNYKKYSRRMTAMAVALLLATGLIFFTITGFAKDVKKSSEVPKLSGKEEVADLDGNVVAVIEAVPPTGGSVVKGPEFPGGTEALIAWLSSNLYYPVIAAQQGLEGKVVVEFTVGTDGKISNATVVEGVHELLDQEAIRLVMSMPDWKPAESNGARVVSDYIVPIRFVLQ
jgi:TonB family protein